MTGVCQGSPRSLAHTLWTPAMDHDWTMSTYGEQVLTGLRGDMTGTQVAFFLKGRGAQSVMLCRRCGWYRMAKYVLPPEVLEVLGEPPDCAERLAEKVLGS